MHLVFVVNNAAFFVSHRLPIAVEAKRHGWRVTLVTGRAGSDEMENAATTMLVKEEIVHHRLPFGSATVNPFRELWGLMRMALLLRRLRPDIVHSASPKGILYGGIAARLAGVPSLVLAISGMGYAFTAGSDGGLSRKFIRAVITALARSAFGHRNRKVIVQNLDDERWVIESGLCPREGVHLIPGSGVDVSYFREPPISGKALLVVFPARLLRDKGVVEFVEAVRLIRNQVPGWRFVVAGAADYRSPNAVSSAEVEAWVAEGLIEWLGYVSDMPSLLAQASVVCLPSYREGLPKALLEAAAAGCAIITADSVGCREAIVGGETGELVPPRDAHAVAAALLALIEDPQRRDAYGRSGRLLARQRFSLEAILTQIFSLYAALQNQA
jgi:glycosyltransferase involved in cell wall biosynthesis